MPKPKDNDTAKELRAAVGNAIRAANAAYKKELNNVKT